MKHLVNKKVKTLIGKHLSCQFPLGFVIAMSPSKSKLTTVAIQQMLEQQLKTVMLNSYWCVTGVSLS